MSRQEFTGLMLEFGVTSHSLGSAQAGPTWLSVDAATQIFYAAIQHPLRGFVRRCSA